MIDQHNGLSTLPALDLPTNVIPLTAQQRAVLAPYREAVAQAQAALQQAFTLLVVGAGVDLTTHTAELANDGSGYRVQSMEGVS